ncbi:MAG: surA [Verrucomicrobiales bacterium]|nr:surA [Verrucomicrobiales bacterium]
MRTLYPLFLAVVFCCSQVSVRAAELVDGIYVVVNDSVITYDEVENSITPLLAILHQQYGRDPQVLEQKLQSTRAEKIEELVQRELVLGEFKTAGYQLPENFVEDSINRLIRERYGDRAKLMKTLQAEGITFEAFRKRERERIIVAQLVFEHISQDKIIISPQKIENYYNAHKDEFKQEDEIHLRMIVLNKTPENAASIKKLAQEITSKLDEGTPFAEMADIYSAASDREKGGDRGWVAKTVLRSELSDAAFALAPGQHSSVIDLDTACYVLFVEDKRMARVKSVTEARVEIENKLKSEEAKRLKDRWINRLRAKSFVRYY